MTYWHRIRNLVHHICPDKDFAHHQDQPKVVSLSELSRSSSLSCSLSTLKRYADDEEQEEKKRERRKEKIKKDQEVLTDLTFYGHQQFEEVHQSMTMNNEFLYMPVYRHYFALTPPNPQLDNPRLLNDYIDWYMNVYLEEEEFSWQLFYIVNAEERTKRRYEQEVEQLALTLSTSSIEKKMENISRLT